MAMKVHFTKTKITGFPALSNDRNYNVTSTFDTLGEWHFAVIIFTA